MRLISYLRAKKREPGESCSAEDAHTSNGALTVQNARMLHHYLNATKSLEILF